MYSVNMVVLVGNLTRDAELREVREGSPVINFGMATSDQWKGPNGTEERTEFHSIAYFGNAGKAIAPFLKKGTPVYVQGNIRSREYEKDGIKRKVTEIRAEKVILLGNKRNPEPSREMGFEDIPF